jgi:hypothetical protein
LDAEEKNMNTRKLLLFVAGLTLAATGFSQVEQKTKVADDVSPDATTACKLTFTSGSSPNYLQFCVTVNGNIVEFKSPQPYEHIREGTVLEGYGICDFGSEVRYFDWAAEASTNWEPATISGSSLPLTIKRTTSDGIYTLTQVISRNTADPAVIIAMTLKNNTAAPHDFSLLRYADVDANNADAGSFHNWFDFDRESAWGYNPGFNLFGMMLYSVPTAQPHFSFVQNTANPPDPCSPVDNLPSTTPWFGDGSVGMDWNGTLKAGKSMTVTGEYRRF